MSGIVKGKIKKLSVHLCKGFPVLRLMGGTVIALCASAAGDGGKPAPVSALFVKILTFCFLAHLFQRNIAFHFTHLP